MNKKKSTKQQRPAKESQERPLNDREEAFCRALITGSSKIDAFKSAGYKSHNLKTLYTGAVRLSKKGKIQSRLAQLREEIKARYALTEENVFKQCAAILNADARNYTKWGQRGVTLIDSTELTEEQALAVEEVSETVTKEGGSVKFKLHSKTKALEIGAKLLGMIVEKKEHTGKDGGPIRTSSITDEELLAIACGGGPRAPKKA